MAVVALFVFSLLHLAPGDPGAIGQPSREWVRGQGVKPVLDGKADCSHFACYRCPEPKANSAVCFPT